MNWKKIKKEIKILKEKKVTEDEIKNEHNQAITFIGSRVYQMVVPALETAEALYRVLHLNREMYKLKNDKKGPEDALKVVPKEESPT